MSSETKPPDVSDLFSNAADDQLLSSASMNVLNQQLQVEDLGAQIQDALGLAADSDEIESSEITLVSVMTDDSGSIRMCGNSQIVRDGHNLVIAALKETKDRNQILFFSRLLNGQLICPYTQIEDAVELDTHNFNPNQGTPLYDQTINFLGAVAAKVQEFADNGITARSVSLIVTDGDDVHSRSQPPAVECIVEDLLATEMHIVAAMGIQDSSGPRGTDFRAVFSSMGIRDEWILTPSDDKGAIRKAFALFSQSASQASQGGASFSATATGGGFSG
jgi:hypothetical protein